MKKMVVHYPPQMDYNCRESVNTIATNIIFSGNNLKRILFTSCTVSEGKTTMVMRIAMNMAERGKKCVLVDMDLRRSMMVRRFGLSVEGGIKGISRYLTGQCNMEDICYQTDIENLYIIPVDKNVNNPIPLINSDDFASLMETLASEFDLVLVDTPPVGVVVDAADISAYCDASVMVIEYGKRHRHEAKNAVAQLQRVGTPVLGCIIDKVTVASLSEKQYYKSHYYYGHYGYGYYTEDGKKKKKGSDE